MYARAGSLPKRSGGAATTGQGAWVARARVTSEARVGALGRSEKPTLAPCPRPLPPGRRVAARRSAKRWRRSARRKKSAWLMLRRL